MKLINITKNKMIAERVIVRSKLWELGLGLLPYKIKNNYIYDFLKWQRFSKKNAMLFKVRFYDIIHTFFMSFPIAVFFMDGDLVVVEKTTIKPFRMYVPKKKYKYFLELVGSRIDEIDINDKLKLESEE